MNMTASKPYKVYYEDYEAVQKALEILGDVEGTELHKDILGIKTSPFGLVLEQGHPAFTYNSMLATELGIDLRDDLSLEEYAIVAEKKLRNCAEGLRRSLGDVTWDSLSDNAKAVMIDAKYNTNVDYLDFAQKALAYEADPTEANLKAMINESTRVVNGKRIEGLDNRVATVLYHNNYIDSAQEAIKYGLYKASNKAPIPWSSK